ncbi:MAG TPA: sensor histidine kinase [Segeticoccus sp.]|uniref:sensor histidine kinase n=1 Tax=Segeticoccus sp. TaxID=2706531 RepID=UPI002D81115D|nr:sensor histidine kinase [Segeticoccus sp.]HET8601843.1 sensor histidine kinase [Segeticoccus sp.]
MSCRVERVFDIASVVMWLVVGAPALSPDMAGGVRGNPWWWLCYVVAGVCIFTTQFSPLNLRQVRWLLPPIAAATVALFLIAPDYPLAPLPMVVFAMVVSYVTPLRVTFPVIGTLVAILAFGYLSNTTSMLPLVGVVLYGAWMVFAALLVDGRRQVGRANQELEQANAELAEAHVRLAETSRSAERLRISRDLHDLVGHQLTALAVNLEAAAHLADGAAVEPVERSRTIAKELLRDVRTVVGQLRDSTPDLRTALQDMAAAVPKPQVSVQVSDGIPEVSDAQREVLLRCVQEAITNAMRHSDADQLWIDFAVVDGETVLRVRDDGHRVGEFTAGNGLSGMQERLAALGGRLSYEGGRGDGFRVEARLPVVA